MNFSDINFQRGGANPSGIGTEVLFCPKEDIASWPSCDDVLAEDATAASVANRVGDFGMVEGKTFKRLYTTFGKGKVTYESTGEADCKSFINKAVLSYPKFNDEIRAFLKAAVNSDMIYLVKHDNKMYIIGHDTYPTVTTPTGDTGDAAGSAKGNTINIECPDETPMPVYQGEVPLSDGTFDCETMTFTPTPEETEE